MLSTTRRPSLHALARCRSDRHRRPAGDDDSPRRWRPLSPVEWLAFAAVPLLAAAWAGVAHGQTQGMLTVEAQVLGSCTVGSGTLDFGEYDPGDAEPLDSTATFTLTCPEGAEVTIRLGPGGGLNGGARGMNRVGGGGLLTYNLYTSEQYTTVWGDGQGFQSPLVIGHFDPNAADPIVYGRVPAGQEGIIAGTYRDEVEIEVVMGASE